MHKTQGDPLDRRAESYFLWLKLHQSLKKVDFFLFHSDIFKALLYRGGGVPIWLSSPYYSLLPTP